MLSVEGAVGTPREFAFADLASLPDQVADVAVLVPGRQGGAARFAALLDAVGVSPAATRVTLESSDGKFSQEAPITALRSALLLYRLGAEPLPADQGGPVRFLVPNLEECGSAEVDRCTNVKALGRIAIR